MRVLHTVYPPTDRGNPFASLLIDGLPDDIESSYFSWLAAFTRRWDVVHFQWPEKFFSASNRVSAYAKRLRFRAWTAVLRRRGSALVLTIHNLASHESQGTDADRELERLNRFVDRFVILNPAVELPTLAAPAAVIPHGHYGSLVPRGELPEADPMRLLYFGFIREYKNVPQLVSNFAASSLPRRGYQLRIVGKPHDAAIAKTVESSIAAVPDGKVSSELAALRDIDLFAEISRAAVVVLPYADLYNSGALVMALTLSRPVIVPRTLATEHYHRQFGPKWVYLFDLPLSPERLAAAVLEAAAVAGREGLDLSSLDWEVIAAQYADTYREAADAAAAR